VTRILRGSYRGGREFSNIAPIAHTSFRGRLPFCELSFHDPWLPVTAVLEGFTSLIPHKARDSSLPAAFLRCTVENQSGQPLEVSLLASFENILGIGGSGGRALAFPLDGPVRYNSTRGNYAERVSTAEYTGLRFATRQNYGAGNPRRRVTGEYLLFTDGASLAGGSPGFCTRWNSGSRRPRLLREFARSGRLPQDAGMRGDSAAFALPFTLRPGESRSINLYLLWWTPYHVIEKRQRLRKLTGRHRGRDYGHYYRNFFTSADELAAYCVRERERLKRETWELPAILDRSSLPEWLKRYVLNSTDAVLVNTVLTQDGTLYTMEGVPWRWLFGALTGTVDQRLAAHPYTAAFFPELDRSELLSFLRLSVDGRVPHGNGHADIALGTHDIPYGNPIKSFNRSEDWTDLPQSLIMQLGKTVLQHGDLELLRECWPEMVRMMEYLDTTLQDDIPEGITTYDYMHYHPSFIYTALLHCATLQMMIELAGILLEHAHSPHERSTLEALIRRFREQLEATRGSCDKRLWDSRGFFHTCAGRQTVFTAALAGDWISRLAGLGPAADYSKALSHSRWQSEVLVDAYPWMDSRAGRTRPLVYREADTEGNECPAVNNGIRLYRVNNPWQSTAYQALEAILLGRTSAGLRLIKRIWDKGWYEGYPWDMDHWGMRGRTYMTHPVFWFWWDRDHLDTLGHVYMTHPVLWALFPALTGVSYHAFTETLTISPRILSRDRASEPSSDAKGAPDEDPASSTGEEFRVPVFLPRFWLMVEYDVQQEKLQLEVLKHFGRPQRVRRLLSTAPDGTAQELPLSAPLLLEEGKAFSCTVRREVK
jgi:hypothetical protein